MAGIDTDRFEKVEVTSAAQLHEWLLAHHDQDDSVWLVTYKRHVAERYVSTDEVLDEVLAFGWTDGVRRKLDDDRTMQLLSPRRVGHWARSYKERIAALEAAGRMQPSGRAAVAAAKASGMWSFMDDVDRLEQPDDLVEALAARPPAAEHFAAFPDSYKRNTLRWIKIAKRPETRAKRIAETARLAQQNRRVPQM
jgi:uncharacterized protein YdeI (YjbR/CyaY-like superfamily)